MARKMINWMSPGTSPFRYVGPVCYGALKAVCAVSPRSTETTRRAVVNDVSGFKTLNSIIISRRQRASVPAGSA